MAAFITCQGSGESSLEYGPLKLSDERYAPSKKEKKKIKGEQPWISNCIIARLQ
jgi:hypothetical protein